MQKVIKKLEVVAPYTSRNSGGMTYELTYAAKEEDVRSLLKVDDGITPQALSGAGFTTRVVFSNRVNSRVRVTLNSSAITANTLVFA